MNFFLVKKITITDLLIGIGLGLVVVGLGIKIRAVNVLDKESKLMEVKKGDESLKIWVDINTASQVELEVLPDIGPKTAQKIIDYRNKWGGFKEIKEIMEVGGIGEKTYENIRDKIKI